MLQVRLDEAEAAAMQGGKKVIQKMEQRIHELEMELEDEQHRHSETVKSIRKQERRLKELMVQVDDDRSTHEKMQQVIEKLHQKLKAYKRQVDETVRSLTLPFNSFLNWFLIIHRPLIWLLWSLSSIVRCHSSFVLLFILCSFIYLFVSFVVMLVHLFFVNS